MCDRSVAPDLLDLVLAGERTMFFVFWLTRDRVQAQALLLARLTARSTRASPNLKSTNQSTGKLIKVPLVIVVPYSTVYN